MMEPTPDGHRAPIAELFKQNTCRSVDTQTPVTAYSTNSSSGNSSLRWGERIFNHRDLLLGASSPCGSVSPWGTFDHHHSSRPPSGGTVEEIGMYQITFLSCLFFPSIYSFQLDWQLVYIYFRLVYLGEYNSLSPEDFQGLSLGTSPRGRFLCREPPDGCEKVETLKVVEHPVKYDAMKFPPMRVWR